LIAFFMMMRKSNLVPDSAKAFDRSKQLVRGDIEVGEHSLMVRCKWSKTNQDGTGTYSIPISAHPEQRICPVKAYKAMVEKIPGKSDQPAFMVRKGKKVKSLSYRKWQDTLRSWLSAIGEDPTIFSSHSFRRGGATWAFQCQVPGEMIQTMGDWKSDYYKQYLQFPFESRIQASVRMTQGSSGQGHF